MRRIATAGAITAALALLAVLAPSAGAVSLQTIGTYSEPVFVTSDPGNPDRLFVVERQGKIELTTPAGTSTFLDLTSRVESAYQERGLLSMAFAPDYATSGLIYVYYTAKGDGSINIDELHVTGDAADPASRRNVITIPHPGQPNHNGGQLQFGPDGYLYAGTGDGGSGNDPPNNAQSLDVLLGKLIRIDPRHPAGGLGYSVPPDNPFVGTPGARPEIWSYGLRNPYRFSFDRATGALLIGDVGQNDWEEIDYATQPKAGRGANFGWRCREGAQLNPDPDVACSLTGYTDPIEQYPHSGGDPEDRGVAVTGGYVVRDPGLTELYGRYVYGDYGTGVLRSLVPALPSATGDRSEHVDIGNPSSFGEDSCGRVYVASLTGEVSRIVDSTPTDCAGSAPPPAGRCQAKLTGDRKGNELNGGPGSQSIEGKAGKDEIRGGDGDDCIDGGPGADRLSGNAGEDVIRGGPGKDVLRARDGERDRVSCGSGKDRALVDRIDKVAGCERKRTAGKKK
jgi:hypothetical protein